MPRWQIQPLWAGKEVFIIGGGPSLKTFDWERLKGEFTIGCNSAFRLGPEVCKVCIFGDMGFFRENADQLKSFNGPVFTCARKLAQEEIPWLYTLERRNRGLHSTALGWNQNTGALAINLAILLGAKWIYLLGYDMKLQGRDSNWHVHQSPNNSSATYMKFLLAYRDVVKDWKAKFSDREIINVTDDSDLEGFPKVPLKTFWEERQRRIAS